MCAFWKLVGRERARARRACDDAVLFAGIITVLKWHAERVAHGRENAKKQLDTNYVKANPAPHRAAAARGTARAKDTPHTHTLWG